MKLLQYLIACWITCSSITGSAVETDTRWHITKSGSIVWTPDAKLPHLDHVEMSGKRISSVIRYGVDNDGSFTFNRSLVFPMLRTIPNNTHASLTRQFGLNIIKAITVNGDLLEKEKVKQVFFDGTINVVSNFTSTKQGEVELTRTLTPSTSLPLFCEGYTIKNKGNKSITIEIPNGELTLKTDAVKGVDGSYSITTRIIGSGSTILNPNDEKTFYLYFIASKQGEQFDNIDVHQEIVNRKAFVSALRENLILETPDSTINTMFSFAKLRASESIYETKGGPMHGPGGESYYAAIWANDEAEYISPFFPYLGYDYGNQSGLNAYLQFARFMNPDFIPLPSSIIAEGTDIWNGVGDRGDAAMIAYGASRYALAMGSIEIAEKLWPLIEWCLNYCNHKINSDGVVTSDTDELENRFPSGKANLCTSSLYYDALISAGYLGTELRKNSTLLATYKRQATKLRKAIDTYFKGPVEGFDTYRYYKENDILRSWICTPLTVGIMEKKDATINALFSPRLWTENGLLTQAGSETFWDRSTLYALRGVFYAGEADRGLKFLEFYSKRRLLGEHVPYAIEAYPEGNQRQLSAESGLYCRIFTEGLFGIRPTGLKSFTIKPSMPISWNEMSLKRIMAFGRCFDIKVERKADKLAITVVSSNGQTIKKEAELNAEISINLI